MQTSYTNNRSFLEKIDALPTQGPQWFCDVVTATGDQVDEGGIPVIEELELWRRDPVECVEELIGNPAFKEMMKFAPERVYRDSNCTIRVYDEAWTGDLWWNIQVCFLASASAISQITNDVGDRENWTQEGQLHQ
jgi:hypothetical protein